MFVFLKCEEKINKMSTENQQKRYLVSIFNKERLVKALFARFLSTVVFFLKEVKAVIPLIKLGSRLQKKNPHRPVNRLTVKKRSGTKITIIKDIL